MSRSAILIGNSVIAQHTQLRLGAPLIKRTLSQLAAVLKDLPGEYAFTVTECADLPPAKLRRVLDRAAEKSARQDEILVVYYFGHGRLLNDDLALVHQGKKKGEIGSLPFSNLLYTVRAHNPRRVLFILDCCYAGAAARRFNFLADSGYCLLACTTPTTRAFFDAGAKVPIGIFTRALMDGLTSEEATASITDDSITISSLYAFVRAATAAQTQDAQSPYLFGTVDGPLSIFAAAPVVTPGQSPAPIKSGYSKLCTIIEALGRSRFAEAKDLYAAALARKRDTFLTPFKDDSGKIGERPAHWTSIRNYISFLRVIGVIDHEEIRLSTRGRELLEAVDSTFNAKLLLLIDEYLTRVNLTRPIIRDAMNALLQRRALPTRGNILTDLQLTRGYGLTQTHLGLTLQVLGHMGVFGMPGRREQVFFPWSAKSRRHATAQTA